MKTKLTILLLAVLATSCAPSRQQYWRDRLANHEADYAKQPGARSFVIAFYNNDSVLDAVALDTQMVMQIERADSFELLRIREYREAAKAQRAAAIVRSRDSLRELEEWAQMSKMFDTGTFEQTQIRIRDLIRIDTFVMDTGQQEEIFFGGGYSGPPRDADGHIWYDYSDSLGHLWRTTHFSDSDGTTILISAPDSKADWHTTRFHCALRMPLYNVQLPIEFYYQIAPLDTWQTVSRYIALAK
jgi:hypothetical protein